MPTDLRNTGLQHNRTVPPKLIVSGGAAVLCRYSTVAADRKAFKDGVE